MAELLYPVDQEEIMFLGELDGFEIGGAIAQLFWGMGVLSKNALGFVFADKMEEIIRRIDPAFLRSDLLPSVSNTGDVDFKRNIIGDTTFDEIPGNLFAIGIEIVD